MKPSYKLKEAESSISRFMQEKSEMHRLRFYTLSKFYFAILAFLIWIFTIENAKGSHVTGITGFYKHGQVFLTWTNASNLDSYYKVYRSVSPIIHGSQLSGCEYLGLTSQYSAKDHDLSAHYGQDLYIRIDSGGTPLASTKGLFVATTLVNGSYYYAVTVILNGVEDTLVTTGVTAPTFAIAEKVSKPQPVFQQIIIVNAANVEQWCSFMSFKKYVVELPIISAGFMASDFLLYKNQATGKQPICIRMHGGGGDLFTDITSVSSNEMNLNVEQLFPSGTTAGYWGSNSNFNIYKDDPAVPSSGMDHNYFQELYADIITWAILHLSIDSNRIYLKGTSAGACGAFAFAITYPDRIAAVSLGVPCFNIGFQNDSVTSNSLNTGRINRIQTDKLLGLESTNLPSCTGINTFDMLNGAWVVHSSPEKDYPFIYAISGKNDVMVGWTEKPIYYDSVNANHVGGYYFWDSRDHSGNGSFWDGSNFDLLRFRRNVSYPAFANCSLNENSGNGSKNSGDAHGSVNGMLSWNDDILDSDSLWEITFFVRDLVGKYNQKVTYADSATTDITPRRIQKFHVPLGAIINWQVLHHNQVVQSGSQLFSGGLITVHGVKAFKDTAQFQLSYSSQTFFYADIDQDEFGDQNVFVSSYSCPSGYVANHSDCNDNNSAVHPDASDICNSIDDNCDGRIDENAITAIITPFGSASICSGSSITLIANNGLGISYQWKKGNGNIAGATNQTYKAGKAGNYTVTEANAFTCSSASAYTTIGVIALPTASIVPLGNLNICESGSVDLQASSGTGISFQWKKAGANISGATNQIFTATTTGTYKVIVTSMSSCSKTSGGTKVTKACKESVSSSNVPPLNFSVYPNPSDGRFTVDLAVFSDEEQTANIELRNIIGQTVYSEKALVSDGTLKKEIVIDHSLAEGIYVVRVIVNDRIFSGHLIYQR